jgi:hypothetical protein
MVIGTWPGRCVMAEDRDERREQGGTEDSEGREEVADGSVDEDGSGGAGDVLEIELEDLDDDEETAPAPSVELLEITLEDLADVDDDVAGVPVGGGSWGQAPGDAKRYPGVDPAALEAEKYAAEEIQMYCLCSDTGQAFHIYWQETSAGVFSVSRVDTAAEEGAGGGGDASALQGRFSLEDFPGCPWCGCRQMGVCDACGTTICEGAVQTTWTGRRTLKCPNCGQRGDLGSDASTAYGTRGGKGKGKKG